MTDLEQPDLIHIKQLKDKYFIFKAKDVEKLRCHYRIVGALNGTLPQFPLQNTFFGLPLILLPEEAFLLVDKGWAKIISKSNGKSEYILREKYKLKLILFHYFWSKGFYITSGIKFGGDYLLYSNDPMCIHSEYIVSIKKLMTEPIQPLELINMGRLATTVKKTFVLAAVEQNDQDKEHESVSCYSIEWAGF